jgi:hypothetical protein
MDKMFLSKITLQDRWWKMSPLILLLFISCMLPNYKSYACHWVDKAQFLEDTVFIHYATSFLLAFFWWLLCFIHMVVVLPKTHRLILACFFPKVTVLHSYGVVLPSYATGQSWHPTFRWSLCFIQIVEVLHLDGGHDLFAAPWCWGLKRHGRSNTWHGCSVSPRPGW